MAVIILVVWGIAITLAMIPFTLIYIKRSNCDHDTSRKLCSKCGWSSSP